MTINHLLNLKAKTKNFAKEGICLGMSSDLVDWSADVQHLIDKEIERQSVTDEEIQDIVNEAHNLLDDEVHDKCDYPTYVRLKDIVYELGDLADRPYQTLESTDKEMQEAIETLEVIMPSEKEMMSGDYAEVGEAFYLAIQALKAYRPTESERVGNSDKLGCKCEQAVCLNGTAYCANCGREL